MGEDTTEGMEGATVADTDTDCKKVVEGGGETARANA